MNILIVDDSELVLKSLSRYLTKHGFEVCSAHNPIEAFELLETDKVVDCIISDVDMPHCNGRDFFLLLRKSFPKMPVVFHTSSVYKIEDLGVPAIYKGCMQELLAAVKEEAARSKTPPL